MPIPANHETSSVVWGLTDNTSVIQPLTSVDTASALATWMIPACLWQNATVTARINTEPIGGIGYAGVASIATLVGSVETSLEGVVVGSQGMGKSLTDLEDVITATLTISTEGDTASANNTMIQANITGNYINSIEYNFQAQQPIRLTVGVISDDVNWTAVATTPIVPIEGDGLHAEGAGTVGADDLLIVQTFKDIKLSDSEDLVLSYCTTCRVSANLNRREIYVIGQSSPIARPVTHPYTVNVSVDMLAANAENLGGDVSGTGPGGRYFDPQEYDWMADYIANVNRSIILRVSPLDGIGRDYVVCSGLRPVDGSMRIAFGDESTVSMNFTGWHMDF